MNNIISVFLGTFLMVFVLTSFFCLGMPYPENLQTAREVEAIVRDNGAIPATIAILDGVPCIGIFSTWKDFTVIEEDQSWYFPIIQVCLAFVQIIS